MDLVDIVGAVRRHWRIPVLVACIAGLIFAGLVVFRKEAKTGYTGVATLQLPVPDAKTGQIVGAPTRLTGKPSQETGPIGDAQLMAAAFKAANLPAAERSRVSVSANPSDTTGIVEVRVSAPTAADADALTTAMANSFIIYRQTIAQQSLDAELKSALRSIDQLQNRANELEVQVGPFAAAAGQPVANTTGKSTVPSTLPPEVPAELRPAVLELGAVRTRLSDAQANYGSLAAQAATGADPFASLISTNPSEQSTPSTFPILIPAAILLVAVLILGVGGAVARARFDTSIRTGRDAATAFGAPVLGAVPRPRRNEKTPVVLRQNGSSRSRAFRSLAATAMASDHLPRLVFVAGPTGRAAGDVASNFAAALATLGLRVALLMTDPRQDGAYGELEPGDDKSAGFDEMLNRMNGASSNGSSEVVPAADVIHMLRRSALTPNLLVAPPGQTATADLSLGGLERLLDALARSSLDIVVIAGPPFLEEPNATIIAHHAGSVLWTIESGHVDQDDAEAASNRLELTGVKSFGLVLVGANE